MRYFRYVFAPRRIRYLFWHAHIPQGWGSRWTEICSTLPGISRRPPIALLDLGMANDGRPKVIIDWCGMPTFQPARRICAPVPAIAKALFTFYNKIGEEVKENKWLSLPKVLRGPVDTTVVVGLGQWVRPTVPGEAFKSQIRGALYS